MPMIRLAHWHGGHPPGATIDVTVEKLALLQRDGRVAEVLPDQPTSGPEAAADHTATPAEEAEPEPTPEPAAAEAEAEAEPPAKSTRRRR